MRSEEVLFGPGVQLDFGRESLEQLADQVQHMDIDGPPTSDVVSNNKEDFLGSVFTPIPAAQLQPPRPVQPHPSPAPHRRQSSRLLARPSSVQLQGGQLIVSSDSSTWLDRRRPSAMRLWRGMSGCISTKIASGGCDGGDCSFSGRGRCSRGRSKLNVTVTLCSQKPF